MSVPTLYGAPKHTNIYFIPQGPGKCLWRQDLFIGLVFNPAGQLNPHGESLDCGQRRLVRVRWVNISKV